MARYRVLGCDKCSKCLDIHLFSRLNHCFEYCIKPTELVLIANGKCYLFIVCIIILILFFSGPGFLSGF